MAWRKGWPTVAEVQAHAAAHGRDGTGLWLIRDDRGHIYVIRLAADSGEIEYSFDQSDGAEWFAVESYGQEAPEFRAIPATTETTPRFFTQPRCKTNDT